MVEQMVGADGHFFQVFSLTVGKILRRKEIGNGDVDAILLVHDGQVYRVADPSHVFM